MVTKKIKEVDADLEKKEEISRYFYAVGKRKTAIAQIRLYPVEKNKIFSINDKKIDEYFPVARFGETARAALLAVGQDGNFDVTVRVSGGGVSAQAEAVRLGTARALIKFDESLRKNLRDRGYLTRDSRAVERKKAGLKKARKSPQWAKR